jgi:hypothetical protein
MSDAARGDLQALMSWLEHSLKDAEFDVHTPGSEVLPAIVAAHPSRGLLAVDIATGNDADGVVALNRKVATLREAVPALARTPAARKIVTVDAAASTEVVLSLTDALGTEWIANLPVRALHPSAVKALAEYFTPALAIEVPIRHPLADEGAADRAARRITLDLDQARIAQRSVEDVLVLTGPPGSGKTLVLASRAKWLAARHPSWRIQLLCYNRMLVPYLERLVHGHGNISVLTVGRLASLLGVRVSLDDEERAARDVARQFAHVSPVFDALLIDEWQDFFPAWTELAMAATRPGRGGIMLAGDPRQALYRDSDMEGALRGRHVEYIALGRPYRSTRQVLEVTSALGEGLDVDSRDLSMVGEPVDLVWAENPREQAAAVTRDIELLLQTGERRPEDIGVLVTRKWAIGRLMAAMRDADIPCRSIYANQAAELDLAEPVVKVMTVHSAKGLEFDVVFLVGLEHLPDPDGSASNDRQGRTGYVGATRARDQLILLYSKDNTYLERVRSLSSDVLRRWVWPDDYPEA